MRKLDLILTAIELALFASALIAIAVITGLYWPGLS